MRVRDVFLSGYPLILYVLNPKSVGVFLNQQNVHPKQEKPLK